MCLPLSWPTFTSGFQHPVSSWTRAVASGRGHWGWCRGACALWLPGRVSGREGLHSKPAWGECGSGPALCAPSPSARPPSAAPLRLQGVACPPRLALKGFSGPVRVSLHPDHQFAEIIIIFLKDPQPSCSSVSEWINKVWPMQTKGC